MSSKYQQQVTDLIKEHEIVVFSKSWCPYCKAAKATLDQEHVEHTDLELDKLDVGDAIQDAIYQLTSQRTVPAIWIHGKFVGGNSDLQTLKRNGKLKTMLNESSL
ncbi:thioredoxin-like protein [Limtongia smithiae]|uniref:thioredoxin-like protein n=1 Tax=Limtongia smithiae TaxID=1125753 RepID=UPI0034CF28CC